MSGHSAHLGLSTGRFTGGPCSCRFSVCLLERGLSNAGLRGTAWVPACWALCWRGLQVRGWVSAVRVDLVTQVGMQPTCSITLPVPFQQGGLTL